MLGSNTGYQRPTPTLVSKRVRSILPSFRQPPDTSDDANYADGDRQEQRRWHQGNRDSRDGRARPTEPGDGARRRVDRDLSEVA